jgi:hypothetical protein
MRWVILCITGVFLLAGPQLTRAARASWRDDDVYLGGPAFNVGGYKFTVPARWQSEPVASPARAGQWQIPPLHGMDGQEGEAVAFYFGPGLGGDAKQNIEAWIGTMFNAEGQPAAAEQKHHETGGLKISQVVIFGTYNQVVPVPGIPPVAKPNYGLLGAVIESPQGNIYWRFTGPEPLITADLPLFNKIIDSVKPLDK